MFPCGKKRMRRGTEKPLRHLREMPESAEESLFGETRSPQCSLFRQFCPVSASQQVLPAVGPAGFGLGKKCSKKSKKVVDTPLRVWNSLATHGKHTKYKTT